MPIKVPDHLPAKEILTQENIFVMDESRAFHQDIRPLKIAILNLMPTKEITETQILRLLGNTPLQIEVVLIHPKTHVSKNTSVEHLAAFYKTFDDIKDQKWDGMIITGAPLGLIAYEEVNYWEELTQIMEWTKKNVTSTLHLCWGAHAGLYYHYGIPKRILSEKIFGVFTHQVLQKNNQLVRGFDDEFYVPHSRHTEVSRDHIEITNDLVVLADSEEAGVYLVATSDRKQVFVTGHSEYDPNTLKEEYDRDIEKGLQIAVPKNYYPNDNPDKQPLQRWKAHANLLFSNWLNYYVYQETPYDLDTLDYCV